MSKDKQYRFRVAFVQYRREDPETGEHICDRETGVTNVEFTGPQDMDDALVRSCRKNAVRHKAGIDHVDKEIVLEDRSDENKGPLSETEKANLQNKIIGSAPADAYAQAIREGNPQVLKSLRLHVLRGRPTGSFVQACLENNLTATYGKADDNMRGRIGAVCKYMLNNMPDACHGSPEAVKHWQDTGGLLGRDKASRGMLEFYLNRL